MITLQPCLSTERLILRRFNLTDCDDVTRLAGAKEVAATTLNIPHPYPDDAARQWISTHEEGVLNGDQYVFAITDKASGALMGAVGLIRNETHNKAELGYWIGVEYWGRGFCTEAARAVIAWGFDSLGLNRIHSCHFGGNEASGRVMQKSGLKYEGLRKQDLYKWGAYVDSHIYGLTREQFQRDRAT